MTKEKKIFWLIGASSGIGYALAQLLANNEWTVAVSARSADRLKQMSEEHPNIHAFPMDVTDTEQIISTVKKIENECGAIHTCMYNAGDYSPMPLADFSIEHFSFIHDVNYMGAVRVLNEIIPLFSARQQGEILLTSSLAGYRGLPKAAPYNSSKAALTSLAESLYLELAQKNIHMRLISPGFVRTPLTDKNDFDMPSLMEPEDAAMAIFKALGKKHFEIRFPFFFANFMNLLRILPYKIFFALTKGSA